MQVLTVIGARPQFIKAAMVSRALQQHPGVREVLVHTGQHYDHNMSAIFFRELGLSAPDHHLGIGSGPHGEQTGRMLTALEQVILAAAPDWVLVYGDTNSTLAGALAAAKLQVAVAHVEAGLRSNNRTMPEEVNRVLTDHVADLLLAPTPAAVANLHREGIADARIHLVGDVMLDAALHFGARAERESTVLERWGLRPRQYVLATVHRAANTDDNARLQAIAGGLATAARELPVVWPLHPRTRAALSRAGMPAAQIGTRPGPAWSPGPILPAGLQLTEPVGYLDMIMLVQNALLVATDSGGLQKEAFFFQVPSVTLREETEWVELAASGWTRLVPPSCAAAVAAGLRTALAAPPGEWQNPYGDGHAAEQIATLLTAG